MTTAIIGYTGFVGGALARQVPFDAGFNSKNIEAIAGSSFDLVYVSAMPAAKWIANGDPAADRAILDRLVGCLRSVHAGQVVIMSTVDVYPRPIGVDEDTAIDPAQQPPYARHRLELERQAAEIFPRTLAVRLPGLFGRGLKKNAIYDLLNNNDIHKIHSGGVFQFYNLDRLAADVSTALAAGLTLVNFATEPISVADAAKTALDIHFQNELATPPARYDMRSKHSELFGGANGYLYSRDQVLAEMRAFAEDYRAGRT